MTVFDTHDRTILRDLARKVADAANRPEMAVRRQKWVEHNALRTRYPLVLVFPEGSWEELLPREQMSCRDEQARAVEWELCARLYAADHFSDDMPLEADWAEPAVVTDSGWGFERVREHSGSARGAYAIKPFLSDREGLAKLHAPEIVYYEESTRANLADMQDLFGDILDVRLKGRWRFHYGLASQYMDLRGLEGLFLDMADAPQFVHEVMSFLTEGHKHVLRQLVDLNLISLNNDNSYHSSGGVGYSDELPAPGFDAQRVRLRDVWASSQCQELALVSPAMHREFFMRYERQLLEPFGLTGYGCCEDLSRKLDDVMALPHMRRISCSPYADVAICAEKLQGGFIFSWKPNPAHLVGAFDGSAIRQYIRRTLDVTQAHGCVLEMVLKDTHTCERHSERFDEWTRIAREEIEAVAGKWQTKRAA